MTNRNWKRLFQPVAVVPLFLATLSTACAQDGFEPFSGRAVARFLGIGSGPGYHVYPCKPRLSSHFNHVVSGCDTRYSRSAQHRQMPAVYPVAPVKIGAPPAYTGCGCNNYANGGYGYGGAGGCGQHGYSNATYGAGGQMQMHSSSYGTDIVSPAEQPTPAKLEGTIEPTPTPEPSTRAHQATTRPREEATRAPAEPVTAPTPPQTGSPSQYDPLAPPQRGMAPDMNEQLDLLSPGSEQLPTPETGSNDPKIWW